MVDIHPTLLTVLKEQLPSVVTIDGIASVNKHVSAIKLGYENQNVLKSIEKVYVDRLYERELPTLLVKTPITQSEAIRQFCERDNLFLIPGTDYPLDDTLIEMDDNIVIVPLRICDDSLFYKGELYIPVKKVD